MTTDAERAELIQQLDEAVGDALAYFSGAAGTPSARVGDWAARDVLQHFIYFHDATAWGMQSVALGGPVWPVAADSDVINEAWRRLHEPESVDDLLAQLRLAHARLLRAARAMPDLDQPCFSRASGEILTGRQRLEGIAHHWRNHLTELRAAS
jgi:hypothetical protein